MALISQWPPTGWPDFDADIAAVPTSPTTLYDQDVALLGYTFVNTSGTARTVLVTDVNGGNILYNIDVPESAVPTSGEWPMMRVTGVIWSASSTGVEGKLWGWK